MLPNDRPVLLRHLRLFQHASQTQVAERIGVKQPTVAKWDAASDMLVSTLRNYIEALGGRLELHAVLKHETIRVTLPKPRPRQLPPDPRPFRNWPR